MVREGLGAASVRSVIGGSMGKLPVLILLYCLPLPLIYAQTINCFDVVMSGGMQALEWCALSAEGLAPAVRSAVVIGCGAQHTAWQIAISETQRQAIYSDPKWRGGDVDME